VRAELALDGVPQRGEPLGRLDVLLRGRPPVGDQVPRLGLELDLAALPRAPPHLHAGLEQGELVGPRGEAAVAAEVGQPAQHRDEGVVGALLGEVVGVGRAAAVDLEARRLQQQRVQLRDRGLALAAARVEAVEPALRLGVEGVHGGHRDQHAPLVARERDVLPG
jgi:hypothetical protein